jgi:ubiquinone/menaquinone biosynthesis C-methylase UbiE
MVMWLGILFALFLLFIKNCLNSERSRVSRWKPGSQEYYVEKFYSLGVTGNHNYNGGYLNFGYWKDTTDYVTASQNLISKVVEKCGVTKDSYLLDVAPGMGSEPIYIHKKYGCKIDTIDICNTHVDIAREKLSKVIEENSVDKSAIAIYYDTALAAPFSDNTYTNIICVEGCPNMKYRLDFLKEAHRLLKSGGNLCISDILSKHKPKTYIEEFITRLTAMSWVVPYENCYTKDELVKYLEEIGYTDISVEEITDYVIPGYYFDQCKLDTKRRCTEARGYFYTYVGHIIDYFVYLAYKRNLVNYVVVKATKK